MSLETDLESLELVVAQMVRDSGRSEGFDAKEWIRHWMVGRVPALGDRRPLDVLAEPGGLECVRTVLLRMQSGAFC